MTNFIPVFEPLYNGNEKKYLAECIDTNWIGANGPFVKKIEKEFSNFCNQKYGSCVANGSAALDIAFAAMKDIYEWADNDEIIIPSFNIISAAQSCIRNNLKPIFVDAEKETWNIDVKKIEDVITPRTRAIVVVHIYGLPSDVTPILNIAQKYNLKIIEDSAQAHGQTYKGKPCGSFSEISTFSFFTNKHISCGEGGIILTSNENLLEKINYYKNLCFTGEKFVHTDLGWNYRMTNLQGAIACAQFEQIEKTIAKKIELGNIYQELLKGIPAQLSCRETTYAKNHYWIFGIVLNEDIQFNAKDAMHELKKANIETRPFFFPMHKQPIFERKGILDSIERPISEYLYQKGFYIPMGLNLTIENQEYISRKIKELF